MDDIVISMDRYRARAALRPPAVRRVAVRSTFSFDLGSPYTYLAAERADRSFALLDWQPVRSRTPSAGRLSAAERASIVARARGLDLPLVWIPDEPLQVPRAMRVAARAAELGRAAEFVLAATRLTFAGSFDVEDEQMLVVAGHVAGMDSADVLRAADEDGRDAAMHERADALRAAGVTQLPVVQVGDATFGGEERLAEAALAAREATRPDSSPRRVRDDDDERGSQRAS